MVKHKGRNKKMIRRGNSKRSGRRMCLIIQHYPCSLFMALLEQPVAAIYTQTVGTSCSLKYNTPGKIQPKKQRKREEKPDYILIRNAQMWGVKERGRGWQDRGGKTRKQKPSRRCKMRKRDRERSGAKIIFLPRILVYHCSRPNYFCWQGRWKKKETITTWNNFHHVVLIETLRELRKRWREAREQICII